MIWKFCLERFHVKNWCQHYLHFTLWTWQVKNANIGLGSLPNLFHYKIVSFSFCHFVHNVKLGHNSDISSFFRCKIINMLFVHQQLFFWILNDVKKCKSVYLWKQNFRAHKYIDYRATNWIQKYNTLSKYYRSNTLAKFPQKCGKFSCIADALTCKEYKRTLDTGKTKKRAIKRLPKN